ncbi:MazG family protein [Actinophytocola xanthii]|uniref:Nucleoside triphosphate pyrophosphohydrolase n=1 Tax=Actinophytocola xanthii TaxID=1912961 RepID=A0A1Q8CLP4_9PSEU|nr:MazG family protein [Actinophytocola xanthii]OLF15276.1 nucleoside triphosphate pyrophosphohydrolase [Actinophytocola xanthii]
MTAAGAGPGTAVVLVDRDQVPAAAIPLLRSAGSVFATGAVGLGLPPVPGDLTDRSLAGPVVLVTDDLDDPSAAALLAAGAALVGGPPAGAGLLDAAAVMDRLRSPGGCPWDAEQTHESLRQYLVEECYELLDAIEDGDRVALREELGDVLLQVLFHARVAQEDPDDPFSIDDVAAGLVAKLVARHPHVFAGGDPAVRDASSQQQRWEELKQQEKRRESCVDGVAGGQPALALAAKLVSRTKNAKLPEELLPTGTDTGAQLFALAAAAKLAGADPEDELRAVARRFAADVRAAESAARAAGVAAMDPAAWRRFWPTGPGGDTRREG